jgi:anti-sigma factor RsiW
MNCPIENSVELLAFSARQLEPPDAAKLQKHLESCSACREFVEKQQAVWEALDLWDAPPIAADFDRRLYQRLEQKESWQDRWLGPLRMLLVRQGLPIAAAACLIVVAGLVSQRPADVARPRTAQAAVENLQPDQVDHALDDLQLLGDFTSAAHSDANEL